MSKREKKQKRLDTPFFSRTYGGYTRGQEEFIASGVTKPSATTILDPMAGQGVTLAKFASAGAKVYLGDRNPAALLLANLRDPRLAEQHAALADWLNSVIDRLASKRRRATATKVVEGWIAPNIATALQDYAKYCGIGMFSNPFEIGSDFWHLDTKARFAAAIAVLAARDIASFRTTDNLTWLKPGGFARQVGIEVSLRSALEKWCDFAIRNANVKSPGMLSVELMDAAQGEFSKTPKVNCIITSPPYANRLDYTRLWAPEIHVLANLCTSSIDRIRHSQIGTPVVEGLHHLENEVRLLPKPTRDTLREIKNDPTIYSKNYYYPFFRNYAVTLSRALIHVAARLSPGGTFMVFVRDTVRKDILFSTGDLVRSILVSKQCGLKLETTERRVIKQHIGFVRKSSSRGLYGLAQQEWWLSFRRPRNSEKNGRSAK